MRRLQIRKKRKHKINILVAGIEKTLSTMISLLSKCLFISNKKENRRQIALILIFDFFMVRLDNMENYYVYPAWPHPHQTWRCFANWGSFIVYLIYYSSTKTIPALPKSCLICCDLWPLNYFYALRKLLNIPSHDEYFLLQSILLYPIYPHKLIMKEKYFPIFLLIWNSLNVFVILHSITFSSSFDAILHLRWTKEDFNIESKNWIIILGNIQVIRVTKGQCFVWFYFLLQI